MTVKELIIKLLDCDQEAQAGFLFYDTGVMDIEISTSKEDNNVLIFSQRFAKIEEK